MVRLELIGKLELIWGKLGKSSSSVIFMSVCVCASAETFQETFTTRDQRHAAKSLLPFYYLTEYPLSLEERRV